MAYVHETKFTHDLFISYARVDNKKYPDEEMGWIEKFIEYLLVRLEKRIGRLNRIKIWRDKPDLAGNHPIDKTIEKI